MGQAESLLRQLDAELVELGLHERDLVLRLRKAVADALFAEGLDEAPECDTVSAEVGGRVSLSVLDAIAAMRDVPDEVAAQQEELLELYTRLRALRADPRNVENLGARALVRRALRSRGQ